MSAKRIDIRYFTSPTPSFLHKKQCWAWAHDYFLVHLYGAAPGADNDATSKLSAAADFAVL